MNTNQKIALLAIAAAVISAFLSPIIFYDYKVDLCVRQLESIAKSWNTNSISNLGDKLMCYKIVNGTGQ